MARLCHLLGVALVASVASQNAASLRRFKEFKNLTIVRSGDVRLSKSEYKAVFHDLGEGPRRHFDQLVFANCMAADGEAPPPKRRDRGLRRDGFDEDKPGKNGDFVGGEVKDDDSLARSKESNTDGEPSALDDYHATITNQASDTINQMVNDVAEQLEYEQLLAEMDIVIEDQCFDF